MNHQRKISFHDEGGDHARESKTKPKDIYTKAEDIITSGQEFTQCANILSVRTLDLLG